MSKSEPAEVWGDLTDRKPDDIDGLMLNKAMVELILLNNFIEDDENGEA